jgi:hypothetical protein
MFSSKKRKRPNLKFIQMENSINFKKIKRIDTTKPVKKHSKTKKIYVKNIVDDKSIAITDKIIIARNFFDDQQQIDFYNRCTLKNDLFEYEVDQDAYLQVGRTIPTQELENESADDLVNFLIENIISVVTRQLIDKYGKKSYIKDYMN